MEDLRLAIIGLGVFSILGILIHGLWTIRKNAAAKEPDNQHDESGELQPSELHSGEFNNDEATMQSQSGFSAIVNGADEAGASSTIAIDDPLLDHGITSDTIATSQTSSVFTQPESGHKHDYSSPDINIADPQLDTDPHTPDINLDIHREPVVRIDEGVNSNYDMDGIGQVRVVRQEPSTSGRPYSIKKETSHKDPAIDSSEPSAPIDEPFPEPPSSLLRTGSANSSADDSVVAVKTTRLEPRQKPHSDSAPAPKTKEKVSLKERARQFVAGSDKTEKAPAKRAEARLEPRVEPKLNEDQIRMDFDQNEPRARLSAEKTTHAPEQPQSSEPVEQEVLVLNVKMPDDKPISGAALLPALLTLGFKFGEQDVFHRHANSNGKGPKLFSLANMFKPGTFNLDNMETFKTQGISLFMILPIEGDPQQVFNMMHNAARKLADEFGAQILDARRSLLTKQSLQQYVEKIREFERKRMINRA